MDSTHAILDLLDAPRGLPSQELAEQIEGRIALRACGRVRGLHVICSDHQIIIQGRTRTHHDKQIAQQAAMDFTDGGTVLTNQIEVQ